MAGDTDYLDEDSEAEEVPLDPSLTRELFMALALAALIVPLAPLLLLHLLLPLRLIGRPLKRLTMAGRVAKRSGASVADRADGPRCSQTHTHRPGVKPSGR